MKALFITTDDLRRKSIIGGNVDADKFIQFIEVSQDIHIQNYLGTKLYNKISTLITGNTIDDAANSDYKTLLNSYITPMLIWFAQSDYYMFASYQVSNGGVFRHRSESSETPSMQEIKSLVDSSRDKAEFYVRRFLDYIDNNSNLFPEYNESNEDGMYPDKNENFNSWVL
ncbi:MAG: hypothetical protein Unbinned8454contig1000_2 [Prokaryotic dsDNA virus sp.]|nr:MAG: hypothetical protein Unbinned8454contig1000_2 [Prokaryotic dsDNA virus sp.]|tara:strand:+ start:3849 stop:4358 length:510 start_codon:yes stop_codon:yes gene_type:complete